MGNEQESTDLKEMATHGLVLMFQSLSDTYTQPVAVFASKNPVKGEEFAKLVVKAIVYLENIGAKIHGVIADGAKTNAKMWSLLDIKVDNNNMKTWFTHPLHDERKVFAFSDTSHLIKNIRNCLYNRLRLRINSKHNYIEWRYFETLYDIDKNNVGNMKVCPKLSERHIKLDSMSKMRVRLATQVFSNSVAHGLAFYKSHGCDELAGCEETIAFTKRMNDVFDALNRKCPNEGVTPHSNDFKVLKDSLQWLQEWESAVNKGEITAKEYLTTETATGLKMTLQSTMDLCHYLIDKFNFKYLLTGKVSQDNLEKFFGTIRQAAGCNDHPNCPTFLQLYKLLSVYSAIKPPKYGNCTVSEEAPQTKVLLSDIKAIYGKAEKGKISKYQEEIRQKLDNILQNTDLEVEDVIEFNPDHDYALSSKLDCIIYYVTGFLFSF